jgi:hypothetical protein
MDTVLTAALLASLTPLAKHSAKSFCNPINTNWLYISLSDNVCTLIPVHGKFSIAEIWFETALDMMWCAKKLASQCRT